MQKAKKKRSVNSRKKKARNYLRKRIQKNIRCNRCGAIVLKSDLTAEGGYSYQCLYCDEDLFTFETHKGADVSADELNDMMKQVRQILCFV